MALTWASWMGHVVRAKTWETLLIIWGLNSNIFPRWKALKGTILNVKFILCLWIRPNSGAISYHSGVCKNMDNGYTFIVGLLPCPSDQPLGPILYQGCFGNGTERSSSPLGSITRDGDAVVCKISGFLFSWTWDPGGPNGQQGQAKGNLSWLCGLRQGDSRRHEN